MIKYKTTPPLMSKAPQNKLPKKLLPDYLTFIHGEGTYGVGFNFSYLRSLSRRDAEEVVDMKVMRVQESILLCILDVKMRLCRF